MLCTWVNTCTPAKKKIGLIAATMTPMITLIMLQFNYLSQTKFIKHPKIKLFCQNTYKNNLCHIAVVKIQIKKVKKV